MDAIETSTIAKVRKPFIYAFWAYFAIATVLTVASEWGQEVQGLNALVALFVAVFCYFSFKARKEYVGMFACLLALVGVFAGSLYLFSL